MKSRASTRTIKKMATTRADQAVVCSGRVQDFSRHPGSWRSTHMPTQRGSAAATHTPINTTVATH